MTLHARTADWLHSPLDLFRAGSLAAQAGAGQAMGLLSPCTPTL